jgi:hypothetical protein
VEIGRKAFARTGIKRVTIPSSVRRLGDHCFSYCSSLTSVDFEGGSRLVEIGRKAFAWTGIERVTIPSSVRRLGDHCFSYCSSLTNVDFEGGSGLEEVGENPFRFSRVPRVELPNSLTVIDANGFRFRPGSQLSASPEHGEFQDPRRVRVTTNGFTGGTHPDNDAFGIDEEVDRVNPAPPVDAPDADEDDNSDAGPQIDQAHVAGPAPLAAPLMGPQVDPGISAAFHDSDQILEGVGPAN